MTDAADLGAWVARQARHSAAALERAISATRLVRRRDLFGQVVVPAPGSVLASPVVADWDPEPDYFFHRSEEHTSELQSLMRISYAVFSLKKQNRTTNRYTAPTTTTTTNTNIASDNKSTK